MHDDALALVLLLSSLSSWLCIARTSRAIPLCGRECLTVHDQQPYGTITSLSDGPGQLPGPVALVSSSIVPRESKAQVSFVSFPDYLAVVARCRTGKLVSCNMAACMRRHQLGFSSPTYPAGHLPVSDAISMAASAKQLFGELVLNSDLHHIHHSPLR
eukprot:SM000021S06423  [mRNA]  locus=s21:90347:92109:- [translate_table: standard]